MRKQISFIVTLCLTISMYSQEVEKDTIVDHKVEKDSLVLKKKPKQDSLPKRKIEIDSIIGTWKVAGIEKAPKSAGFKQVISGYKKASFQFHKDSTLLLATKSPNVIFSYILRSVNKSRWIANDSMILIGTERNKYATMKIRVIQKQDTVLFQLNERTNLPLILQVKKEE